MEFGYCLTDFPYNTENDGIKYLKCTSFIIIDKGYGPILFDTGSILDYKTLLDFLKNTYNLLPDDIRWVFITHIHPDHIGANRFFKKAKLILSRNDYEFGNNIAKVVFKKKDLLKYLHENCPGYISSIGQFEAERMEEQILNYWTDEIIGINKNPYFIEDSPDIPHFIKIIQTKGHTFHHYSFQINIENIKILVTGDALSMRMILRESHEFRFLEPHMDFDLYFKSLAKLKKINGLIIPGHDRAFFSHNYKPIRKNNFQLKDIKKDYLINV